MFFCVLSAAPSSRITGRATDVEGKNIESATVSIPKLNVSVKTDSRGHYYLEDISLGNWTLEVRFVGFDPYRTEVAVHGENTRHDVTLAHTDRSLNEVVISGTMKEVTKLDSPVPVEVYTFKFFRANPTPSLFGSLQNINGVQAQVNCSVCNTRDIHINGLEGPIR